MLILINLPTLCSESRKILKSGDYPICGPTIPELLCLTMKCRSESRHRNRHDIEWYSCSHHSPLYCLIFLHHSWSTRYTFKWGRPKRDSDPKTVLDLNFGLFLLLGLCLRLALLAFLRICLNKIECPIYQIS